MNIEPKPSAYAVSVLPEDHHEHYHFTISVERTHHTGTWAVRWMGGCLNALGEWEYEPLPSSRDDDWLAEHRFGLAEALHVAVEAAPELVVNGRSAAAAAVGE